MLVNIIDSQLLMFPTYKTFFYRGSEENKLKFEFLTIKLLDCSKDLNNFDYMGLKTGVNEITLLVNPIHYQDLIHLHMCRQKPNTMFLQMNKKYVSYYGFNC